MSAEGIHRQLQRFDDCNPGSPDTDCFRPPGHGQGSHLSQPTYGCYPQQTSNLLYLRRVGPPNRSLLYRRAEQRFAFGVSWSSLTPGYGQAQEFGGRQSIVLRWAHSLVRDGAPDPWYATRKGGQHASYTSLFCCTYSFWLEFYGVQQSPGYLRP